MNHRMVLDDENIAVYYLKYGGSLNDLENTRYRPNLLRLGFSPDLEHSRAGLGAVVTFRRKSLNKAAIMLPLLAMSRPYCDIQCRRLLRG